MQKTLLPKMTSRAIQQTGKKTVGPHIGKEADLMRELSKDMLSPRPEAVNRLLELSRTL